jgi:hypothetical protein
MLFLAYTVIIIAIVIFKLPLGVLFISSLFAMLYTIVIGVQRNTKLSKIGTIVLVFSLLCAIYSGLIIFINYNLLNVIFK